MLHPVSISAQEHTAQRPYVEARVTRHLRELFDRLPRLAGFRLRSDFTVAEVSAISGAHCTPIGPLHVNVMRALVEVAECDSEAVVRMRGKTFARNLC